MVVNQIPRAAKRFLMYILVFIVLQGLFIMSNMAAQLIPREPIEQHLDASSESPLLAYAGDHSHKVFGSDVSFDNNVFIGAIALQETHANPFETSVRATIDVPSASFVHYDYFRYWHGWQLLTDACLYFGTIELLQVVVLVLSVAASVAYTVQLSRCIGIVPALVFGILLLFSTNLFGNFMGDILLSISFFAALGICAGIIFAGRQRASGTSVGNSPVFLLCMVCGAAFNFLDFLTVPAMVLGLVVFSVLVPMQAQGFSSETSIGVRKLLLAAFRAALMFVVGYAGTWVVKWLLVAVVLGPEATFQNIAQEIGIWTTSREQVMNTDNAYTGEGWYAMALWLRTNLTWLYSLLANAGTVIYGNVAGMMSVLATVICMAAAIITRIKSTRPFGALFWCSIAAAGVPLVYFVLMANHAATHRVVFGYKNWALTMAVMACMSVVYCRAVQSGRPKSKSR